MLFKNKTLLAKTEVTYGVDSTPAGTDAVLTSNLNIQPYAGPTVSRDLDRSTLGAQTVINTNPQVQITFDVEVAGSGTAATPPPWGELLQACGFAETIDTDVTYAPVSSGWESVSLKYYADGQLHTVLGARGNVSVNLARGAIPKMSFTFTGTYTTPVNGSPSGVDITDYQAPIAVTKTNTPTYTLDAVDLTAESFAVDMGNNVVARNVINAEEIMITDRAASGTTVFETVLPGTQDWFTDAIESHNGISVNALELVHGTAAGNIVTFAAPAVQSTAVAMQDSDGLLTYSMSLSFTPSSGNDELTISTS
jgi:hypothetical protein